MNTFVKANSVPESRPVGLILKSKKPIQFLNVDNNLLNRMNIALSEIDLEDEDNMFYFKNFKTFQYNENIIIVSNTENSEMI
jgi:hypothetical protein